MTVTRKISLLLLTIAAFIFLPWLGSYINHKGVFPPDFFVFPSTTPFDKPSFNWLGFIVVGFIFVVLPISIYLFPALLGFKKVEVEKRAVSKKKLPLWFWIGFVLWASTTLIYITKSTKPVWLIHWSDLPIYWGFVLMIDGWVYVRNEGKSLISRVPEELIGIGIASMPGWMLYEYFNFFVDDYWYYPNAELMSKQTVLMYAIFVSSVLIPLAFEWYCLFNTFPKLKHRFSNGIKIVFSERAKTGLLIFGLALMFAVGLFPDTMFVTLWIAPPIVLGAALDKLGIWTPLKSIGKGNWSPTFLFALTYLLEGFLLEGQNFITAIHSSSVDVAIAKNPLYWKYSIPYVDAFHIFEMPLLGYAGYLPFGVYCWLWWIACATLMNIPSLFLREEPLYES